MTLFYLNRNNIALKPRRTKNNKGHLVKSAGIQSSVIGGDTSQSSGIILRCLLEHEVNSFLNEIYFLNKFERVFFF